MPKVKTDKKLIEKFLTRGVEAIYPSPTALRKKLMSGERLRIYQGFDPTGPYLHVGHAIGIRALRILQQLGHEVIFLVGDYTSLVGDPDQETSRSILSEEQIKKNMLGWRKQTAQLINFSHRENPVRFERNSKWLAKLQLKDLINLMSHTTVQRMLERDLFARRLKKDDPIHSQEILYPLMQGYDSVAMKVDVQIGGTDQIFNMLMARRLVKAYLGKEMFVRANKMMEAPDGITMSKTKGNGINLTDSPEEMYGKAMSYPDKSIIPGLELLTDIPEKEIAKIERSMKRGENPVEFKRLMAREIVKVIKGEKSAQRAEDNFAKKFGKLARRSLGEGGGKVKADFELSKKSGSYDVIELLVVGKLASSKSDARRKIREGAVEVVGQKVTDEKAKLKIKKGSLIRLGKRFLRIK